MWELDLTIKQVLRNTVEMIEFGNLGPLVYFCFIGHAKIQFQEDLGCKWQQLNSWENIFMTFGEVFLNKIQNTRQKIKSTRQKRRG